MAQEDPTEKTVEKIPKPSPYPLPPEKNVVPHSHLLDLFHAGSMRREADVQLTVKSIVGTMDRAANYVEWSNVNKCKAALSYMMRGSNKTIKENMASRLRFQEKIKEGSADTEKSEERISKVKREIEKNKNVAEEMENHVKNYSVYEAFLESVAQASPEFHSGGDIINRFETLENARLECERVLEMELESFTELRREMISLLESESSRLKELRNRVVGLQVQQKQAKERRMYWEHTVERMKVMIQQRKEEELIMSGGCWDLYQQICKSRKIRPTLSQKNLEGQLDFIVKTINFMKEVNAIASANVQDQNK